MIQWGVLPRRRSLHNGIEPVADTRFGKGSEGGIPVRVILPHGLDEAEHPLLHQVLAVSARQKIGPGAGTNHPMVTGGQNLLRRTVLLPDKVAQRLVRQLFQRGSAGFLILCHSLLYLFTKEFVKSSTPICQNCIFSDRIFIRSAKSSATFRAISVVFASTMTRIRASVPEGRIRTRPFPANSCSI